MYNELTFEVRRKLFHLSGMVFPLLYLASSKMFMCVILIICVAIAFCVDIVRAYHKRIAALLKKYLGQLFRANENGSGIIFAGSSYMMMGLLVSCILFTKELTIVAWAVLIVSDTCSAIVGMMFGTPLFNGKSYVGSIAFFISSIIVSLIGYYGFETFNTNIATVIIVSFITTIIEFFSDQISINDNFSIPITYAFSTFVCNFYI